MEQRLGREVVAQLRLAVHRLRTGERRRVFPAVLHLGELGVESAAWAEDRNHPLDVGLRSEVAAALLSRALLGSDRPAVWLTRSGVPLPHDQDLAWLGPVTRCLAEAQVRPRCLVVVTTTGWYAPLTGETRTWKRLRIRPGR
ncbi:hypothetical protein [Nocardioides donggukensis]|uniref:Uncharacterized protein n=1 Tax=Nocardioides donggukensis TaxID=2774019 RepID=A0A927K602_9ACTN|nr:hypothetical protein [Nocardioides donggukensis]MBD8869663.1 hypothetical protein [Nocardioides donggukensis]